MVATFADVPAMVDVAALGGVRVAGFSLALLIFKGGETMQIRQVMVVVGALLLGLVLGNWPVQTDLRKARGEIADLKKQLKAHGGRGNGLQGVTSMLRIPEPVRDKIVDTSSHPRRKHTRLEDAAGDTLAETNAVSRPDASAMDVEIGGVDDGSHEDMRERVETAMELWRTRSEIARNNFLGNIAATPEQTQAVDQLVAAMNQQLGDQILKWSAYMKAEPDVGSEAGVRMMHELSSTLVGSYDELDRALSPDWRTDAGKEFQLLDFVSPDVVLPLTLEQ